MKSCHKGSLWLVSQPQRRTPSETSCKFSEGASRFSLSLRARQRQDSHQAAWRLSTTSLLLQYGTGWTTWLGITHAEDARGRYTLRTFSGGSAQKDMYFLYDDLDRVTCRRDSSGSSCPTSGFRESFSYNTSSDRSSFTIQNAVYTTAKTFTPIYVSGSDALDCVLQDGSGAGCSSNPGGYIIDYSFDGRGNRKWDDSDEASGSSDDKRAYTYDTRNNLVTVTGKFYHAASGTLHDYVLTNAYDERNRRVFKSFKDTTPNPDVEAQWFYYYDQWDRLIQAKHTPDIATATTFSVYQWYWLSQRAVLYYQIDCSGTNCSTTTTTRRYLHSDEQGRPHAAWSWPASGDGSRVWEAEAGTFGWDVPTVGATIFQPLRFPGQHYDVETEVRDGSNSLKRPGLADNRKRGYDVLVGAYLQVDYFVTSTWEAYIYAAANPVLNVDPDGLRVQDSATGSVGCYDDGGYCSAEYSKCVDCGLMGTGSTSPGGGYGNYSNCMNCVQVYLDAYNECQYMAPDFPEPDPGNNDDNPLQSVKRVPFHLSGAVHHEGHRVGDVIHRPWPIPPAGDCYDFPMACDDLEDPGMDIMVPEIDSPPLGSPGNPLPDYDSKWVCQAVADAAYRKCIDERPKNCDW